MEHRTAGLWRRGISVTLDTCFGVLVVVALYAAGILDASPFRPDVGWFWTEWWLKHWLDDPRTFFDPIIVLAITTWIYVFAWEGATGRTPGDRAVGIEVVDGHGDRPGWLRAGARALVALVNVASLGLGWLWAFVSPNRRALHDVLSGTWVVRFVATSSRRRR